MLTCNWLGIEAFVIRVDQPLSLSDRLSLRVSGNYIMARADDPRPNSHFALYTGISRNLADRLLEKPHEKWSRAEAAGVTHVHIIRCDDEQQSRDVETILRYFCRPPLQDQPRPLHLTAHDAARRLGSRELAMKALVAHAVAEANRRAGTPRRIGNAFANG